MNEENTAAAYQAEADAKSLERLYDYTKFHIGVYLTLTASYITIALAQVNGKALVDVAPFFLWRAVMLFMLAGLAGGVIVSSLTQTVGGSSRDFLDEPIGPWDLQVFGFKLFHFRARVWTYIEHTAFWLGLICAVLSFLLG